MMEDKQADYDEEEYQELQRAERFAKKTFKKMNYHGQIFKGCLTCKHCYRDSIEDEWECLEVHMAMDATGKFKFQWKVATVDELDICDNYEVKP